MRSLYLISCLLVAINAHHQDPYDSPPYYPHHPKTTPSPPPFQPYSSERFLDVVRPRDGPVDLVFLVPRALSSVAEVGAAKELAVKTLTLFSQNNPFVPDGSGLHFGIVTYNSKPKVVLKLSDGTTSAASSSTDKIVFEIDNNPDDLAKALHAAYEQFKKHGRTNAKKVLVVFVASETVGDVVDVVAKLKALGVEIYVFAVGEDVNEGQISQIVGSSNVIFFETFAGSANVRFLLSTFVPIPRTRKTKPPQIYPVYPKHPYHRPKY